MKLDVTSVFKNSDEKLEFDYEDSFADFALPSGENPVKEPLRVKGGVFTRHGAVTIEFSVSGELELTCDRCLKTYSLPLSCPFSAVVSNDEGEEENEKLIVAYGHMLDLAELSRMALLLWLPVKQLCREDCPGLCPICGADLSQGDCGCVRQRIDPRLEGLRKLLEQKED
ncbi:MAG: DUF177 domain-containing protein [Clostridia bacterium]|nr:DUF177 domain-containing protein [Clostridia bacterium]